MVNTPIPHSLKSEAKKAAKILREFSIPNSKVGPDKIIPTGLIVNARGLAIITVAKLGFLVTARGGSGIVIAKLDGGGWSAPSAICIAGLGGGFEIGAEVTDFVIILNKAAAVEAFSKGGNLTLGGNFTIAAGPIGRNIEGDISIRSPAAIYTYSRTIGLFAGISVEGSALIERKEANRKFYGESVRAYQILNGQVDPPASCEDLYDVLAEHENMFQKAAMALAKRHAIKEGKKAMRGEGLLVAGASAYTGYDLSKHAVSSSSKTKTVTTSVKKSSIGRASSTRVTYKEQKTETFQKRSPSSVKYSPSARRASDDRPRASHSEVRKQTHSTLVDPGWDSPPKCKALWDFHGQMNCDLTFREGDEIIISTRTATQEDWWEGTVHGKTGIFPANYVEVI